MNNTIRTINDLRTINNTITWLLMERCGQISKKKVNLANGSPLGHLRQ